VLSVLTITCLPGSAAQLSQEQKRWGNVRRNLLMSSWLLARVWQH
jgi:hypothetical protein